MSEDDLTAIQANYQAGQAAFERGEYRKSVNYLEQAIAAANPNSGLGGEVQLWLVTAYQAAGLQPEAIALCQQMTRHPDLETRKQAKRLLYILEAPQLQTRPEWLTQIPDLGALERDRFSKSTAAAPAATRTRPPAKAPEPAPIDLSQVNTEDNRFTWVALVAVLLIFGGLLWLS